MNQHRNYSGDMHQDGNCLEDMNQDSFHGISDKLLECYEFNAETAWVN